MVVLFSLNILNRNWRFLTEALWTKTGLKKDQYTSDKHEINGLVANMSTKRFFFSFNL